MVKAIDVVFALRKRAYKEGPRGLIDGWIVEVIVEVEVDMDVDVDVNKEMGRGG